MGAVPSESEPRASYGPAIENHSPDTHTPTENECIEPEASQNEIMRSNAESRTNVPNIPANKPISLSLLRSLYPIYPDSELEGLKEQLDIVTSINSQIAITKFFSGDTRDLIKMFVKTELDSDASEEEIEKKFEEAVKRGMNFKFISADEEEDKRKMATMNLYSSWNLPINFERMSRGSEKTPEAEEGSLADYLPPEDFVYHPLGPRAIRLLRLTERPPRAPKGCLALSVKTFTLDEAPPFTAVSYTWGDPTPLAEIRLNGKHTTITQSLDYALKRILTWKSNLYLWADGLCINQQDISERNTQVRLMGDIYSRAEYTAAYLGEPPKADIERVRSVGPDHVAFALMEMLCRIWAYSPDQDHERRSDLEWNALKIPDGKSGLAEWVCLLCLCSQPWFSRSWVLQEVVLAKVVVVLYGEAVNNLDCLVGFWDLATRHELPPALQYGPIADWKTCLKNSNQLNVFGELRRLRESSKYIDAVPGAIASQHIPRDDFDLPGQGFRNLPLVLHSSSDHKEKLLDLLIRNRAAGATDARDKVYSLLSLASDVSELRILPNYSQENSTAKVYRDVACAYIQKGDGVKLLHHAGLPRNIANLPSWVPDWSLKSRVSLDLSLYHCTKRTHPMLRLIGGTNLLIIRGAVVDALAIAARRVKFRRSFEFGHAFEETGNFSSDRDSVYEAPLEPMKSREELFITIVSAAECWAANLKSYPTGEKLEDVVWRTFMANRGWIKIEEPEKDRIAFEAYKKLRGPLFPSYPPPPPHLDSSQEELLKQQMWPFQARVLEANQGYRFGVTACGHMGLFPNESKNDDLIFIIPGASTPFIIRPDPNGTCFTLVGDCYVHGMMNGELLVPCRADDHAKVEDEDGRHYKIRLRPWSDLPILTVKKAILRRYFDPDSKRFADIRDLRIR
ncbi:uncharacterized protein PAC_18009 [Phialocephala subalpina]|uniref:Heterokaryon incompatibility domain-containing protein n=1 Tax=Phialocephala subalpina TaxID=576137 RepID=A0A1L7XSU9_9HELO|nr:uncharacterized protein PAC_18009 [Phialocephala subalpina]